MDFYEKPNLENIKKDRENRAFLHHSYRLKFLVGTVAMILVFIICLSNETKTPEKLEPKPYDYEIAQSLNTLDGREAVIGKKYHTAKIISESIYKGDIISVFEVDNMCGFYVFEPLENGYWQKFCGSPFSKTALIKGTVPLGDNTHEYDIYLQVNTPYTHLLIDRENMTQPHNVQQQKIAFDENGIAIMELDPDITDPAPRIVAYDNTGNHYILADGTL